MTNRLLLLIAISILPLTTAVLPLTAFADYCDDLTHAGLNFGIPAATYTVNAGDRFKVPVVATITDPASWDSMDHVELQLSAEISQHEGAATMTNTIVLKDAGKLLPFPTELEFQTSAAMGGDYLIGSYLTGGDCGIPSNKLPGVTVAVVNAPANIELDPPVVKDVHFSSAYDINKPVTFTADIADHSAVCVDGLKGVTCMPTFDIYFGDADDGGLIFTVAKISATPKPGRYALTFQKAFWRAGQYTLYGMMVQDKWGNTAGELPAGAQKVINVTGIPK